MAELERKNQAKLFHPKITSTATAKQLYKKLGEKKDIYDRLHRNLRRSVLQDVKASEKRRLGQKKKTKFRSSFNSTE